MMRAQEMVDVQHGVPRGRRLSERTMVDTYLLLQSGEKPRRAYQEPDEVLDTSVAAVLSLDQSRSIAISGITETLRKCMLAIAEPTDNIGGHVMAFGWRIISGSASEEAVAQDPDRKLYHRFYGVRYDIFKLFDEKLASVKWRFARTNASGGTPMVDGIEYGLRALSDRPEGHRFLWVITDGKPPALHLPIIQNQKRRAREAGIVLIGVGAGDGAQSVREIFDNWVYQDRVEDLPAPLLRATRNLLDRTGRYRGRRVRSA